MAKAGSHTRLEQDSLNGPVRRVHIVEEDFRHQATLSRFAITRTSQINP